eukprot:PhF_6_TR31118/c1_g1_i1/m.45547
MLHHAVVEVLTTKMRVSVCGNDLKESVINGQKGNIERTATQVEDEDVALSLLAQTIGDGGSGGLIDDTSDVETRDHTGILCGLTLSVVEVGRYSHNGVLHSLTQVRLGDLLHLLQDHRADFFRSERLLLAFERHLHAWVTVAVDNGEGQEGLVVLHGLVRVLAADQTFNGVDRVVRVLRQLVLRTVTNQTLCLGEGNDGRCDTVTHLIGDDLNFTVLPHTDDRVRGAQVDTDDGAVKFLALVIAFAFLVRRSDGNKDQ